MFMEDKVNEKILNMKESDLKPSDKVYCKTCKYKKLNPWSGDFICLAEKTTNHDYYEKRTIYKRCSYKNEDNDCKYFEEKKTIIGRIINVIRYVKGN